MLKRQQRKHLNCPICNEPDEDIMHVMTCRSPSASELRETQLQELQLWLRSRHTDPVLTSFIIKGLRSWFRDPYGDEPLHHCPNPVTFRALTNQLELGWFALLYGYITTDITRAQHTHFWTTIGKNKATRGQSNFILNYRLLRITYGNIETKSSMRRTQCMPSAAWKSYDLRSLPNTHLVKTSYPCHTHHSSINRSHCYFANHIPTSKDGSWQLKQVMRATTTNIP